MFSQIDGETVIMSIENNSYYGIDAIGSRIWELLENNTSFNELLESLHQEFKATPDQIENDTYSFLQALVEEKLISIED